MKFFGDDVYWVSTMCRALNYILELRKKLNFITDVETNGFQKSERKSIGVFMRHRGRNY